MAWETHPARTSFQAFAAEWDRLNNELFEAHPLFDSRFVAPLLEYFSTGKERLCIYRVAGKVVGALILQPDGIGRWSSFKPSQAQATPILISDATWLRSLIKTLPGFAWALELLAVDPRYAPDFTRLDLVKLTSPNAQTIGIRPDIGFLEYWNRRPKNLKANVRRYFNRVEKETTTPVLSTISEIDAIADGVTRFGELESAGWKGTAGTAVSGNNLQGQFYVDVLKRFAQTEQATIYELGIDNQLAASRLVISSEKMFAILKTTYDETLSRFAPGRLLLYHIIQEQLESHNGKTLEFYTNATRDQAEWTTFGCTIQNIQVFGNDIVAAVFSLLKVAQRFLRGKKNRREVDDSLIPKFDVQVVSGIPDLLNEQHEPNKFAASDSIENTVDWFALIQDHVYCDDLGVRYYFVAEDGQPTTIAPLRLSNDGQVRTIESLGNYYTSLYAPLQAHESQPFVLREILATATRDHGGAHVMRFSPMDVSAPVYQTLIDELQAIGWVAFRFFCFGNWFLKAPKTWEDYLKQRSGNLRSSIKRRSKHFLAEGGTLEVVTAPENIDAAIAAFQQVYMASWKVPEPHPEFVPSLIRRLATLGMLRLGIAWLQGRPIAAQLWIVGQDKASIYKVAYHEDFSAYSPGTVLTAHLMQHVIDRDHVKEVDFLIGDDKYKQIWMSHRRERWGIVAYNPRTLIGFALLLKEVLARTTKTLRTSINSRLKRSDRNSEPARRKATPN